MIAALFARPLARVALVALVIVAAALGGYAHGVQAERARAEAAAARDYIDQRRGLDALPAVPDDPDAVVDRLRDLAL